MTDKIDNDETVAPEQDPASKLEAVTSSNDVPEKASIEADIEAGTEASGVAGDEIVRANTENDTSTNNQEVKENSSGEIEVSKNLPIDDDNSVSDEEFDSPVRTEGQQGEGDYDGLIINLDGYEGPLDVLLDLARRQKVDIVKISMLALVEQYLAFIEEAQKKNLELAADYLVMASWLAYLKTKLLLPQPEAEGDEPTADEMATRLAFQLQRLEAMRKATQELMKLPRLGLDVFPRGCPEGVRVTKTPDWQADLYELLKAYTTQRVKTVDRNYRPDKPKVFSLEEARARLSRILGMIPEWSELRSLSPIDEIDAPQSSVIASAFHAALEFAKEGKLDIRQLGTFEPIYIKSLQNDQSDAGSNGEGGETTNRVTSLPEPGSQSKNKTDDTDDLKYNENLEERAL